MTSLARLNVLLVALLVLHTGDHVLRQSHHVPAPAAALGLAGTALAVASLGLALARHPAAPAASILAGFGTALGFFAIHVAPRWSAFSDPYPDLPVDAVSWVSMVVTLVVGLWLGVAGLRALRRARPAAVR